MTYPSSSSCARGGPGWRRPEPRARMWALVLAVLAALAAGSTRSLSDFTGAGIAGRANAVDSVYLSMEKAALVKLFGDSILNDSHGRSCAPGVTIAGRDTLRFFWAESTLTSADSQRVYRRDIVLRALDAGRLAAAAFTNNIYSEITYLHADRGKSGYFASYLSGGFAALFGATGSAQSNLLSGGNAFSSQCALNNDTFLVIYKIDNNFIVVRKIRAVGATITTARRDTIARATSIVGHSEALINPSVAADSNGMRLALWTRKIVAGATSTKVLEYKLLSAAMVILDSGAVRTGVGESSASLTYFDDAPVVSYARNKFAAACWNMDTVFLYTFVWDGAVLQRQSSIIARGTPSRSPAICANGRYVVVAWKGDFNADSRAEIDGMRFPVAGGTLNTTPLDTFGFSDPLRGVLYPVQSIPASNFYAPLACVMDSAGNIGLAWPDAHNAWGCIWALRQVLFPAGRFVSAVDSPDGLQPGDSVRYLPSAIQLSNASYGAVADSLQMGTSVDTTNAGAWSAWAPARDAAALSAARTTRRYFRYKFDLSRGVDSLRGPAVRRYAMFWDVKPVIASIDSARAGGAMDRSVADGDTLDLLSRSDSVRVWFTCRDADPYDSLRISSVLVQQKDTAFRAVHDFYARPRFVPLVRSDTIYACTLSAMDSAGWPAVRKTMYFRTSNAAPQMAISVAWDSAQDRRIDTTAVTGNAAFAIAQNDSISFIYRTTDANDASVRTYVYRNSAKIDSANQGVRRVYTYRTGAIPTSSYTTFRLHAYDGDDSTDVTIVLGVNHAPSIVSVDFNGAAVSDSANLRMGAPCTVRVAPRDDDRAYWDSVLTFRFTTRQFDSTQRRDSVFVFVPNRRDTLLRVIVRDYFGKADTQTVWFRYSWLSVDPADNPALGPALDTLADHMSIITGAGAADTIALPLRNTGNASVSITGVRFTEGKKNWRQAGVALPARVSWSDTAQTFAPVVIRPQARETLCVRLFADSLRGDGIVYDTLIIATDDPAHPLDTIPLRLEYNDLPRITAFSFDFAAHQPYWLAKKASAAYRFPPHARLQLTFSEPMDTSSARNSLACFSVLDSLDLNRAVPIRLDRTWSSDFTRLFLSPVYEQASVHFSGLKPPAGFFIPTDSVALVVLAGFTDRAQTPSGPNALDVNQDFHRDLAAGDTMLYMRVDSITFTIATVRPDSVSETAPDTPVTVVFTAPVYPGTITTQSLQLRTRYHPSLVRIDSVRVTGSTARFYPAKRFFYGDTVRCRYRGVTGRDTLGYPIDLTSDGIPMSLFDSLSAAEDKSWWFAIASPHTSSVSPPDRAAGVTPDTAITVRFSAPVTAGTVDTAHEGNRSLYVTAAMAEGDTFGFDSVRMSGSAACFYPRGRFYFNDTVRCVFNGLLTGDTAQWAVEPAGDTLTSNADTARFSFSIRNIRLASMVPAPRTAVANLRPAITLRFSDRIFPGTLDAGSLAANRSLFIATRYSEGHAVPFRSITVSADSQSATFIPDSAFYGYDSVSCAFLGFPRRIHYDSTRNLPDPNAGVIADSTWYFQTGDVGFYIFPDPYKPGKDPRHCGNPGAPCGIWFKNLHALRLGITEVRIEILDMKGFPVYESQKAGTTISFAEGSGARPAWLWNTENTRGDPVASGLYFYVIRDTKDKVLIKGKLIIVR